MKYRLIMNPSSCSGRGSRKWEQWLCSISRASVEYESFITRAAGDAFSLARDCMGECTVVAVGGDGTINEVVDGIMQSGNPLLSMGVLYAGTSPDFCRFQNIPVKPEKAIEALLDGKTTRIDVCRVHYTDKTDKTPSHFVCSCNIGMGASVAQTSNRLRRYFGDKIGTAAAVIINLFFYKPVDLELIADNQQVTIKQVNNLSIVKNPYIASGLKLGLDLRPDDGAMWLFGVTGKGPLAMASLLTRYYTGSVISHPGTFLTRCTAVEIRSTASCQIEYDGDPRGHLPVRIELLEKALPLKGVAYE